MCDIENLYHDLLYAVENKYPNESRHETALRYIKERESEIVVKQANKAKEEIR